MKKDLSKLMTADGVIAALAIDQRGALKKMLGKYGPVNDEMLIDFKKLVAQELTPYASSYLVRSNMDYQHPSYVTLKQDYY